MRTTRLLPFRRIGAKDLLAWHSLIQKSNGSTRIFLHPSFAEVVDEVIGGVEVVFFEEDKEIVCVLPLQRDRGVAGWLGGYVQVGGEMSDYFNVVGLDNVRIDSFRSLNAVGVGSLYFTHASNQIYNFGLPSEGYTSTYRLISRESDSGMLQTAMSMNAKYWKDAERCVRKMEREIGPLRFEWNASRRAEVLAELVDLKCAQYRRTGRVQAPLFAEQNVELLRRLSGFDEGQLQGVVSALYAGDFLVAIHMGLRSREHLHYWFPVYDLKYSNYSPGKVLLYQMIAKSKDNGVSTIDFGAGAADYKIAAANEEEILGRGLAAGGVIGRISTVPRRMHWRLNPG